MPDCDSGSLRMHRLLLQLVELGERVVFFPCNGALPQPYTADLQRHGITVIADAARQDAFLREAGAALRLAVLSRPQVGWKLLEYLRMLAPRCLVSFDTVDVHFLRLQRQAELAASTGDEAGATALAGKAAASRELELGLVRAADVTLVVSEHEQALLRSLAPEADVRVLSNVHFPAGAVPGPQGRAGLLFVAASITCPTAMRWPGWSARCSHWCTAAIRARSCMWWAATRRLTCSRWLMTPSRCTAGWLIWCRCTGGAGCRWRRCGSGPG
jgi:O-antigen biosynthesis protein